MTSTSDPTKPLSPNDPDEKLPPPKVLTFQPYAYAVADDYVESHCWYCLIAPAPTSELALTPCESCGKAWFCSDTCRDLAEFDHDDLECPIFKTADHLPGDTVRLLARVCHRFMAEQRGQHQPENLEEDSYLSHTAERPIMDLIFHAKEQDADPELAETLAKLAQMYDPSLLPAGDVQKELLYRLLVNNFNVYLDEQPVGLALYLDLTRYDHSCAPNAFFEFEGFEAQLRGIGAAADPPQESDTPLKHQQQTEFAEPVSNPSNFPDLRDPSQTFISYIPLMQSREDRRAALRGKPWYFECECSRCTNDDLNTMLEAVRCQKCRQAISPDVETCPHCEAPTPRDQFRLANTNAKKILDQDPFWAVDSLTKLVFSAEKVIAGLKNVLADENINLVKLIRAILNHYMRILSTYGAGQSNYAEIVAPYFALVLPAARVSYPAGSRDQLMVLLHANNVIGCSMKYCADEAYLPFVEEIRRILVSIYGGDIPSRRPYAAFVEFLTSVEDSLDESGLMGCSQAELEAAQMDVLTQSQGWASAFF